LGPAATSRPTLSRSWRLNSTTRVGCSPVSVCGDDGTTNLAPPQFDDGTLCIEGTDSDGAEKNPYTTYYDPLVALSPTLRDMAATYVSSLTVASMRKAARMLSVKQSLPRAQMRGLLFAAAAARVHCGDGGWLDVLGDDYKSCITDPANQTNP
jgi:hypothetical protein